MGMLSQSEKTFTTYFMQEKEHPSIEVVASRLCLSGTLDLNNSGCIRNLMHAGYR